MKVLRKMQVEIGKSFLRDEMIRKQCEENIIELVDTGVSNLLEYLKG